VENSKKRAINIAMRVNLQKLGSPGWYEKVIIIKMLTQEQQLGGKKIIKKKAK
jgi:hypothetical protein